MEDRRILLFAWAALMGLTLVLALTGDVTGVRHLGTAMLSILALAAVAKAHLVLRLYLGLGSAPGALAGFTSVIVLAFAIVVASFLVFPTPPGKSISEDKTTTIIGKNLSPPARPAAVAFTGAAG